MFLVRVRFFVMMSPYRPLLTPVLTLYSPLSFVNTSKMSLTGYFGRCDLKRLYSVRGREKKKKSNTSFLLISLDQTAWSYYETKGRAVVLKLFPPSNTLTLQKTPYELNQIWSKQIHLNHNLSATKLD